MLRDHVVGVARLDARDAQHRGVLGGYVAGYNRLQRRRQMAGDHDGVDAFLRPRPVRAFAGDLDVEESAAGEARPFAGDELPDAEAGMIVQSKHAVAWKALEQPV